MLTWVVWLAVMPWPCTASVSPALITSEACPSAPTPIPVGPTLPCTWPEAVTDSPALTTWPTSTLTLTPTLPPAVTVMPVGPIWRLAAPATPALSVRAAGPTLIVSLAPACPPTWPVTPVMPAWNVALPDAPACSLMVSGPALIVSFTPACPLAWPSKLVLVWLLPASPLAPRRRRDRDAVGLALHQGCGHAAMRVARLHRHRAADDDADRVMARGLRRPVVVDHRLLRQP